MKDDIFDAYCEAGRVAAKILKLGGSMVTVGRPLLDVAQTVEDQIHSNGLGIAFPMNISLNADAAHDTPSPGDERVFVKGDMVKLDLGVHLDGYIADTAMTVDLGSQPLLVEASRVARDNAIAQVKPGVAIGQLGAVVQHEIESRGFKPVANLTGHGLDRYTLHMGPNVPNIRMTGGAELVQDMVIAIEPFASTGTGHVSDRSRIEIYKQVEKKPVRMPAARKLLKSIEDKHGLPFARRHLELKKPDLALTTLCREGVLYGFPVLGDVVGSYVSQSEHTIIVTEDGCIVTTA